MRISKLKIRNYRTLEDVEVPFSESYSAICGKNDSGKSNIVRAIRCLMQESDPYGYPGDDEFTVDEDYTKWCSASGDDREIDITLGLTILKEHDQGLHEFLADYLELEPTTDINLCLHVVVRGNKRETKVNVGDLEYTGIKAQSVLQRLQSAQSFFFHNSTTVDPRFHRSRGLFREFAAQYSEQIEKASTSLNRLLKRIAREQQESFSGLIGRLSDKYKVGLSLPAFSLNYFPFDLTLGDTKVDVNLDDWGSGTRNRTMILLTLFRARQIALSSASASKITPIIVVEEPESFLHPVAQAEFGSILQDLSEEFGVQLIVTTHSPYLLSRRQPSANILVERKVIRRQLRQTEVIPTNHDKWMEPFALVLGMRDTEFNPWKELLFSTDDYLLLVEGELDREYFTLLQDPAHGSDALPREIEVFPYHGKDTLKHQSLVKFIRYRFKKVFITFDLDAKNELKRPLDALGLQEGKDYIAVGVNKAGQRNIEGLLPAAIHQKVSAENPDIVQALVGTPDERKSAKSSLKRKLLDEFKASATPGEDFKGFYSVAKAIRKNLQG
jgi:putative ATP-dependent endonuclease of OLD family